MKFHVPLFLKWQRDTISPPAQNALPLPFKSSQRKVKSFFTSQRLKNKEFPIETVRCTNYLHHHEPDIWIFFPILIKFLQPRSLLKKQTNQCQAITQATRSHPSEPVINEQSSLKYTTTSSKRYDQTKMYKKKANERIPCEW